MPNALPYAAKAGLNTLTEGFARAFGPSVRVEMRSGGLGRLLKQARAWDDNRIDDPPARLAGG